MPIRPIRAQIAQALQAVAAGQSLDAAIAAVHGEDRELAFARALLYQTLRHHYSADALLRKLCQRKPRPNISALLRAR